MTLSSKNNKLIAVQCLDRIKMVSDKEASVLKVLRNVRYLICLYLFSHILIAILSEKYSWLEPINTFFFVFFLFAGAGLLFLIFCDCPRCGKTFFGKRVGIISYGNFFTRKCFNCGLSINADKQREL